MTMLVKLFSIYKWSVLFFIIAISSSCATVTLKKQEVKPVESYKYSSSKDALTVAVQPMSRSEDCIEYFGSDLIANKILPIFIVVENKNPSLNFTIFKEKITMQSSSATDNLISDKDQNYLKSSQNTGEALSGTGAVISSGAVFMPIGALAAAPFLLVAGAKQMTDSATIKYNFTDNEFRTKTITPGKNSYGFVYLKIPETINLKNSDFYILSIIAKDIENDKQLNFEFKISL